MCVHAGGGAPVSAAQRHERGECCGQSSGCRGPRGALACAQEINGSMEEQSGVLSFCNAAAAAAADAQRTLGARKGRQDIRADAPTLIAGAAALIQCFWRMLGDCVHVAAQSTGFKLP
eukprot:533772-Pelagomonas_calceolata.AAC.16